MKKKILRIILMGVLVFGLAGCGNNNKTNNTSNNNEVNNPIKEENIKNDDLTLSCSGPYILTSGIIYSRSVIEQNHTTFKFGEIIGYRFSLIDGTIGDGEYVFTFNKNKLISVKSKETFSKEVSAEITNEELHDIKENENYSETCKAERKNGRVVLTCEINEDDSLVKALSLDNGTIEELKTRLEKDTTLTCK